MICGFLLYIDPGSGSYIVQVIAAAALGIAFFFKIYGIKGEHGHLDNLKYDLNTKKASIIRMPFLYSISSVFLYEGRLEYLVGLLVFAFADHAVRVLHIFVVLHILVVPHILLVLHIL